MTNNQSKQPPKQPLAELDTSNIITPNTIILDSSNNPDVQELHQIKRHAEQNAQARLLLIQLQWLVIILMIGTMIWQSYTQKQLAEHIDNRLQQTEKFTTRMNDLDDRLFAMTPIKEQANDGLQTKNDVELMKLLLNTAQTLYKTGDHDGAIQLLQSIAYKLENKQYQLAAPISASLKQSLAQDISHLQTIKASPDVWHLYISKMRNIQNFLDSQLTSEGALTWQDLQIHDANMLLNLSIHSALTRERDATILYLQQAQNRLNAFSKNEVNANDFNQNSDSQNHDGNETITTFHQAIFSINEMLADMPKTTTLNSIQLLNDIAS